MKKLVAGAVLLSLVGCQTLETANKVKLEDGKTIAVQVELDRGDVE